MSSFANKEPFVILNHLPPCQAEAIFYGGEKNNIAKIEINVLNLTLKKVLHARLFRLKILAAWLVGLFLNFLTGSQSPTILA